MKTTELPGLFLKASDAALSADGLYRYWLSRRWDYGTAMAFIMLNPSTADADHDDPTIRRCISYAKREGHGAVLVANLFAYRTTWPAELWKAPEPEGPLNWSYVSATMAEAATTVFAWGALTLQKGFRSSTYRQLLKMSAHCLGTTRDGSPRHPLYCRADAPLSAYPVPS